MRCWLVLLSWIWTSLAFAQSGTGRKGAQREMSLQECIEIALKSNLDVQIERYNPEIALYNVSAAKAGYDPGFSFSGQHDHGSSGSSVFQGGLLIPGSQNDANTFNTSLGGLLPSGATYSLQGNASDRYGKSFDTNFNAVPFDSSQSSASINISQPLLKDFWIDSTRLNIKVAKNRLKFTELGLRQRVMVTATSVEQAYYDLIYAHESVRVQAKAVELAEQLVTENRKRVEVGAMAPLDEKQAESQAAASRADLISAQNAVSVVENELKKLLSENYSDWATVSVIPSGTLLAVRTFFDLQDSWSKGLTQRPDYLQAKLDVERAGFQLKYNYNQLFPELNVFGSYGYNGNGDEFSGALGDLRSGDRPFWSYGGSISFPLSNTGARSAYKTSKAAQSQTILFLKRTEQEVMVQIDNDIKSAQSAYERVDATRQARLYAEAALDAGQKKLENGKSTAFEVLQLQRDLTSARGSEIRALADYNKALAQLALDEGSTLERRGIEVDAK